MRDHSSRHGDSGFDSGVLWGTSIAGIALSGLMAFTWNPADASSSGPASAIIDRGAHQLDHAACTEALSTLLARFRDNPDVLWVWVEQSVPAGHGLVVRTKATSVSPDAPRPYAVRPNAAVNPEQACGFTSNSVHALSMGGIAQPYEVTAPDPWSVAGGP
ncbi:hypothetical protein FBZ84_12167 [Azospirillum baldaniorum]|uniref:hypothetical protein n=1 Tax=Azospirillum baldaniorum TaxID=1064539 RepID=UPI0011A955E2|nr:hypothetical protein [Azospirillum baldaniorum]TWA57816.1 hypothetical protein FBZ84_12167 [Azospirillum baldaniorum]